MYSPTKYFPTQYFSPKYFMGAIVNIAPTSSAIYNTGGYFSKYYFSNKYFQTGMTFTTQVFVCSEMVTVSSGYSAITITPFTVPSLSSYDSVQRGRWGDVLSVFFTLSSPLGIPFSIDGTPLFAVYDSASNLILPAAAMTGYDSLPSTLVRGYPTLDTRVLNGAGVYYVVGNFNLVDASGLVRLSSVSITMLVLS